MAHVKVQGTINSDYMQICYNGSHYITIFKRYEDLLAGSTNSEHTLITAGCNNSCSDWEVLEAKATEPRLPELFLAEIGLLSRVPEKTYAFDGRSSGFMYLPPGTIIPANDQGEVTFLHPGEEILRDPKAGPTYYKNEDGHLITEGKANREARLEQLRKDTLELLDLGLPKELIQKVRGATFNDQVWCVYAVKWTNKILDTVPKSVWLKALPQLRKFSQAHRPIDSEDWYEGELERLVRRLKLPPLSNSTLLIVNPALIILQEKIEKS